MKRYVKRPVVIDAILLEQYGDFVRAAQWINHNGGRAVLAEASPSNGHEDYLLIHTLEGTMEARAGWYVIRGVKGEFYPCEGEIFALTYEEVPEEPVPAAQTGTGLYAPHNAPDSRTSLVGGAARALPT